MSSRCLDSELTTQAEYKWLPFPEARASGSHRCRAPVAGAPPLPPLFLRGCMLGVSLETPSTLLLYSDPDILPGSLCDHGQLTSLDLTSSSCFLNSDSAVYREPSQVNTQLFCSPALSSLRWDQNKGNTQPGILEYTCHLSPWEAGEGTSGVQGQPGLHSRFQASRGDIVRPVSKNKVEFSWQSARMNAQEWIPSTEETVWWHRPRSSTLQKPAEIQGHSQQHSEFKAGLLH